MNKVLSKSAETDPASYSTNEAAQQIQPMLNTTIKPNTHNLYTQFIHSMIFGDNENLQLHMLRLNGINNREFSVSDLRARIFELEPGIDQNKLDTFQDGLRTMYSRLLLKYPNKIPYQIEPRPEIKELQSKLESMSAAVIENKN